MKDLRYIKEVTAQTPQELENALADNWDWLAEEAPKDYLQNFLVVKRSDGKGAVIISLAGGNMYAYPCSKDREGFWRTSSARIKGVTNGCAICRLKGELSEYDKESLQIVWARAIKHYERFSH